MSDAKSRPTMMEVLRGYETTKPSIKLYVSDTMNNRKILDSILYGAEEEGVPVETVKKPEANAVDMAHQASMDSNLGIGIGVSAAYAAVHEKQLPKDKPVYLTALNVKDDKLRYVGANAARLVKRLPLKID